MTPPVITSPMFAAVVSTSSVTEGLDAPSAPFINATFKSVVVEWADALRAQGKTFRPPRLLLLRTPPGHPAHGSAYAPRVGLVIDLTDVEGVNGVFGEEARPFVALMIAHEVGHHVQRQIDSNFPAGDNAERSLRERQADCYAGWWLAAANRRSVSISGSPAFAIPDLDRRLPRILNLLAIFESGHMAADAESQQHGSAEQRVAALRRGLASKSVDACGWENLS